MKGKEKWPHQDEEWVHKDGSGLVVVDAMFENETFYTYIDQKWTCKTEDFKKLYTNK